MKHILAWHDEYRGDCLIEIWSDGKVWHWFYRDSEILRYQQDIYYGSIFSLKRRLRERFYPPRSLKFCLTKRAPDAGDSAVSTSSLQASADTTSQAVTKRAQRG